MFEQDADTDTVGDTKRQWLLPRILSFQITAQQPVAVAAVAELTTLIDSG